MRAPGVHHPHLALGHAPDAPRVRPQQEDVAHHRLDGEVLVDGAHGRVVGLGDHAVVAHLGDGAAAREGGEACPAPRAQHGVHAVAVHVRHALPPAGGDAVGDQLDHGVEVGSLELGERSRSAHQREEPVLAPFLGGGHLGHDLLGQDVERGHGGAGGVEASGAHRGEERRALHQLVARHGVEDPLGGSAARVVGASHPLEEGGDGAGRSHLAHELHRPDVDAELERRRGHERPEITGAQAVLHAQASVLGQAAVVRGHLLGPETLAEEMGEPFRQPPRVHEHQRGAVRAHVVGDAVDHLVELLGGRHRGELGVGELDADVEAAGVTAVHDGGLAGGTCPGEQARRLLDGTLGRRQADALGPGAELEMLEAFEGDRQV